MTAAFPAGTRETLLFLATAGLVVPFFTKLKVSPVLGFLFAGIALGPYGVGKLAGTVPALRLFSIGHDANIAAIAEFGVVFLLFMLGLELSFARLATLRRLIFGLGPAQVVASAVVLGLAGMLLGVAPGVALVVGGALALSSTAIVVPVLAERKRLNSTTGRMAFALLLFQDLAVAPLLFAVSVLADGDRGGSLGWKLVLTLVPATLAVAVLVIGGRLILRPLFHLVAVARSTELFTAASLLVIVGTGAITAASGLSMAIGAFIAGLLLAETEYRREIEVTIDPFKGLLLGLFFVSVGTELDLSRLVTAPGLVLGLAVGLVILKAVVLYGAARLLRMPRRVSAEVSLLLAPGGEFAFVLINQALAGALLPADLGASLLVAVTLTMMATPVIARAAERLARRLPAARNAMPLPPPPDDGQARVLIVGYGRVGRLVAEMVTVHRLPFLVIDDDPAVVARARDAGLPVTFGDATRPEFLRLCGIADARALVVTVNIARVVEQVVVAARAERADLTLVARARDAAHAAALYRAGVTDAVPETIEASLQLSEAVLVDVGIPMGLVIASVHDKRDEFRRLLNGPQAGPPPTTRERRAIRRTRDAKV